MSAFAIWTGKLAKECELPERRTTFASKRNESRRSRSTSTLTAVAVLSNSTSAELLQKTRKVNRRV
jgi:hypothetical protein